MIKKILVMVVLACFSLTSMFGQNAEDLWGGGTDTFVLGVQANTGTFADDTTGQFTGNSFDLSVEYIRNFDSVSWLDLYGKLAFSSSITPNSLNVRTHYPVDGQDSGVYPMYLVNGVSGFNFGLGYMEGGVRFGSWGMISMRQDVSLRGEVRIPLIFTNSDSSFSVNGNGLKFGLSSSGNSDNPVNISFVLYGGIHAYPFRIGSLWNVPPGTNPDGTENPGKEGLASQQSIKDLYGGLSLGIGMGWTGVPVLQDMTLVLDGSWRTNGSGTGTTAGGSIWKFDSIDSLKYNGGVRADVTLNYVPTKRFSTFLKFRYEGKHLPILPQGTHSRRDLPSHDFYLQGGLTYRFGGSK